MVIQIWPAQSQLGYSGEGVLLKYSSSVRFIAISLPWARKRGCEVNSPSTTITRLVTVLEPVRGSADVDDLALALACQSSRALRKSRTRCPMMTLSLGCRSKTPLTISSVSDAWPAAAHHARQVHGDAVLERHDRANEPRALLETLVELRRQLQ